MYLYMYIPVRTGTVLVYSIWSVLVLEYLLVPYLYRYCGCEYHGPRPLVGSFVYMVFANYTITGIAILVGSVVDLSRLLYPV